MNIVRRVRERSNGVSEEYNSIVGVVSINYDKFIIDGDIGIFKMCF